MKKSTLPTKQRRGFAIMKPSQVLRIASMGGKAVSKKPGHMARLGRKGGKIGGKVVRNAK